MHWHLNVFVLQEKLEFVASIASKRSFYYLNSICEYLSINPNDNKFMCVHFKCIYEK